MPCTSEKETKSPLSNPCRASSRQVTTPGLSWLKEERVFRGTLRVTGADKKACCCCPAACQDPGGWSPHLGNHGNHSTEWLLPIGIGEDHFLSKVTEELPAEGANGADARVPCRGGPRMSLKMLQTLAEQTQPIPAGNRTGFLPHGEVNTQNRKPG